MLPVLELPLFGENTPLHWAKKFRCISAISTLFFISSLHNFLTNCDRLSFLITGTYPSNKKCHYFSPLLLAKTKIAGPS
jgi:hypothetical protein